MQNKIARLHHTSVARAVPSFYVQEYPKLIEFLEKYLEYVRDTEGWGDLLENLKDIRNIDLTDDLYSELLRQQFGGEFPDFNTLDDTIAIKVFENWFRSKGTQEAIEAYFRLFLNSQAEVSYPRDQLFEVDGGNWSEDESRYLTPASHVDELTMKLQDDDFYQIYSYLIKSGVSLVDWGDTYKSLAHPAGWNFFGQVQITELAMFKYLGFSPTIVPGFQLKDSNILLFSSALYSYGVSPQLIQKFIRAILATSRTFSFAHVNVNLYLSTYTIGSWADVPVSDFDPIGADTRYTDRQRPARILISEA